MVNNSGATTSLLLTEETTQALTRSGIIYKIIDSPKNNIATGRNIVLDQAQHSHVAFIDDDEIARPDWLIQLTEMMLKTSCTVVTGPVHAKFPESSKKWLRKLDLHNTTGRQNGDIVKFTGTGNVLINSEKTGGLRFDEIYGRSGGSDTDFFLRVTDKSDEIRWAANAELHETIPEDRASLRYFARRAISQGTNFRKIMTNRGEIKNQILFTCRAACVATLAIFMGLVLMIIGNRQAGRWLKRAFANIGFLVKPKEHLYDK